MDKVTTPLSQSAGFIPLKQGDRLTQAQFTEIFPHAAEAAQRLTRRLAVSTKANAS